MVVERAEDIKRSQTDVPLYIHGSNPEENKETEGKGEQHPKKKDVEKSKGSGRPYYVWV